VARLSRPPANRDLDPLHFEVAAGTALHRIYDPDTYRARANSFRFVGPFARFDHHAKIGTDRGILYAAADLKGCLVEVFGDQGYGRARNRRYCGIVTRRRLLLLELRGDGALRAGAITAICAGSHAIARLWSRYFYEHPELYGQIDGLAYRNAHNEGTAYALYERCANAFDSTAWDDRLDDEHRRSEYERAAAESNLDIAFYGRTRETTD